MARRSLRERLCARLADVGFKVAPTDIHPAMGGARSSPNIDAYRWEAHGLVDGVTAWIVSYDTMTDCARFGIDPDTLVRRSGFELSALRPKEPGEPGGDAHE